MPWWWFAPGALAGTWYPDGDGDGYGASSGAVVADNPPSGFVATSSDCDDGRSAVYPGASETCNAQDDDCDGGADESACGCTDRTWSGNNHVYQWCGATAAWTTADANCRSASYHLASLDDATEAAWARSTIDSLGGGLWWIGLNDRSAEGTFVWSNGSTASYRNWHTGEPNNSGDEDCGEINRWGDGTWNDEGCGTANAYVCEAAPTRTWYRDVDGDGFGSASVTTQAWSAPGGYVSNGKDCDDGDGAVNPAAAELCDATDRNCDGDATAGATDLGTWYADVDDDGYGNVEVSGCAQPLGAVAVAGDCNDNNAAIRPGAGELCDATDRNCDGDPTAGASDAGTWYRDADADLYGSASQATTSCALPVGYVSDATDCNDGNAAISPGDAEACNGFDDDCDGMVDESDAQGTSLWYPDQDNDGYGASGPTLRACAAPNGYRAVSGDCNDANAAVSPGDPEVCNGIDDDCDTAVDESGAQQGTTWYLDADKDGYGDPTASVTACQAPASYVANDQDCDDTRATVSPVDPEVCNDRDDDCDDAVDEQATDAPLWYADDDLDGFGDANAGTRACDAPSGAVSNAGDCDDADERVSPDADEACGGGDEDCDGQVDEADASDAVVWYDDDDGDGAGDSRSTVVACNPPPGHVAVGGDCDDHDGDYFPGAEESCTDDRDLNCDGAIGAVDGDHDGFFACEECNDADDAVFPGAAEVCNAADDDCDGVIDEGCEDTGVDSGETDTDVVDSGADTGPRSDTATRAVPAETGAPIAAEGCGCASTSPAAVWAAALLAAWATRRRRA